MIDPKPWPQNKLASVYVDMDMRDPIVDAIKSVYELKPINGARISYEGMQTLRDPCDVPEDEWFHPDSDSWHKDQGRDHLDQIIDVAIRVGAEYGQRRMIRDLAHGAGFSLLLSWCARDLGIETHQLSQLQRRLSDHVVEHGIDATDEVMAYHDEKHRKFGEWLTNLSDEEKENVSAFAKKFRESDKGRHLNEGEQP